MALQYSEVEKQQKEKDSAPLNTEELAYVQLVEKYIDGEILKNFQNSPKINIPLHYFDGSYNPITGGMNNHRPPRREKMKEELVRRYSLAGWRVEYYFDDGLDGPNMSGSDYAILSKKTRKPK